MLSRSEKKIRKSCACMRCGPRWRVEKNNSIHCFENDRVQVGEAGDVEFAPIARTALDIPEILVKVL